MSMDLDSNEHHNTRPTKKAADCALPAIRPEACNLQQCTTMLAAWGRSVAFGIYSAIVVLFQERHDFRLALLAIKRQTIEINT